MLRSRLTQPKLTRDKAREEFLKKILSLPSRLAVLLIRGYQIFLSPFLGKNCRFYPTCSQYAMIVYQEWGFFKGTWLTVCRLAKCGPWHEGGYDPPPLRESRN